MLNEKKSGRDLGREKKKKKNRRHFFVGRTERKFCSGGGKMRNASGHQFKVKMSGSGKKSEREQVRHFLQNFKTCN